MPCSRRRRDVSEGRRSALQHALLAAKGHASKRELHGVIEKLSALDRKVLMEDLEAAMLLASAFHHLFFSTRAMELLHAIEDRVTVAGDPILLRRWRNLLACQYFAEGDFEEAEELYSWCLSSAERSNHGRIIVAASGGLAAIRGLMGEVDVALSLYTRALAAAHSLGMAFEIARLHHNVGLTLREWGRYTEAFPHFMHAADYYAENGILEEKVFSSAERSLLLTATGDTLMAEQLARTAQERCKVLRNPTIEVTALRAMGVVLRATGRLEEARANLIEAVRLAEGCSHALVRVDAYEEMALVEAMNGHGASAEYFRNRAVDTFGHLGLHKHCERFLSNYNSAL